MVVTEASGTLGFVVTDFDVDGVVDLIGTGGASALFFHVSDP
jgi:hypothetical protein